MRKFSYKFIVIIGIICLFSSFAHSMKRKAEDISILTDDAVFNNISIPSETLEQIFTYLCDTSINVPFIQKKPSKMRFFFYVPENNSFKIAPNGIVGYLATMRSVCKHWRDNVFNPAEIKHRLNINSNDIVTDLDKIKATGNRKHYSHVQFLAQMVKNQINSEDKVCDHILIHDPDKLKIFLENGLADPKYNDTLVLVRKCDKIIAYAPMLGNMLYYLYYCFFVGCFFYLFYKDSCMSEQWQTKDHPWKELINESLCNLCSNIQKSHEVSYPSLFVKDYYYRYYNGCNVCNGTDFKSTMALYDQCIEGLFASCKNQCGIFNEVYGRWIRMGIEKWSNG